MKNSSIPWQLKVIQRLLHMIALRPCLAQFFHPYPAAFCHNWHMNIASKRHVLEFLYVFRLLVSEVKIAVRCCSWKFSKKKVNFLADVEFLEEAGSADIILMETEKLSCFAYKARTHLLQIHTHSQVWDIFISKEIEVRKIYYSITHPLPWCCVICINKCW